MAMFKYVGDPDNDGEGPDTVTCYGVEFAKGEPAEVADAAAVMRLSGNKHFEKVDGRTKAAKTAKKKPADKAEDEPEAEAE